MEGPSRALAVTERALTIEPFNAETLNALGVLHCERGDLNYGVTFLRLAVRAEPARCDAHLNLMRAYERLRQGVLADYSATRSLILSPAEISAWLGWCRVASDLKSWYARAIITIPRLQCLTAANVGLLSGILKNLRYTDDDSEGQLTISIGLAIDPASPAIWEHLTRGNTYWRYMQRSPTGAARRLVSLLPSSDVAHFTLSGFLLRDNSALDAIESLAKTICLKPGMPEAWVSLGVTEKTIGRFDRALCYLPRALVLRPDFALAAARYGRILAETGHLETAVRIVERAVELDAQSFDAWSAHAFTFRVLENYQQAESSWCRCITLRPERAECWVGLGIVKQLKGKIDIALREYDRAIILDLFSREALPNQALALKQLGRYEDATKLYQKAVATNPDLFDAYVNSAICNLLLGNFALGWRQYEFRWRSEAASVMRRSSPRLQTTRPEFSGTEDSKTKRILVWAEQGLGDEIMFGSLLEHFSKLCGEMVVQVDRRLIGLFMRAIPSARFVERGRSVPEQDYDEHIPIGSLGKWLRPTLESFIGHDGRYLSAEEGLARQSRFALGVAEGELLVGLSWRSSSPAGGEARSLDLEQLVRSLSSNDRVRFLNLQYGDVQDELDSLSRRTGVKVLTYSDVDNFENIGGLAALIEACDLVVSVGNATAHLAGALGARTVVLLPFVAGWRWLNQGDRCPWYSSVKIYRQKSLGDWSDPLRRLAADAAGDRDGLLPKD